MSSRPWNYFVIVIGFVGGGIDLAHHSWWWGAFGLLVGGSGLQRLIRQEGPSA